MARIGIIKFVPENIQLYKNQFHQVPWNTECLTLHLEFPSEAAEGWKPQQHRVQSPQRQMANALAVQSLANTLGKCQFVVDISKKLEEKILSAALLHSMT